MTQHPESQVALVPRNIDNIEQLKYTNQKEAWRVFVCLKVGMLGSLLINLLLSNSSVKRHRHLLADNLLRH